MPIPNISSPLVSPDYEDLGETQINQPALVIEPPEQTVTLGEIPLTGHMPEEKGGSESDNSLSEFENTRISEHLEPHRNNPSHPVGDPVMHLSEEPDLEEGAEALKRTLMTPLRMVVMGMIFIASGILWFALDDSAVHENPLMFGDAEFSYAGDLVRVRVPVESELLLMLAHPGGRRAVANQSKLSFALERDEVALGHRPLNFQARVNDTVVPVHAKITAWYRLELIDATAHSMEMQLLHDAAHTVRVSPGRLESLTESNHRWVIESNGHEKLTTVPVEIIVEIPGEDPKVFHDDIVRPNLYTPLTLLQPPSRFYPIEDRVQVVGYTMPGAQASAMGEETVADDQGRFSFMISRDKKGQNPILIRVHSEGRLPNERPIEWGSVSSEKRGELLDEQRHDLNQVRDEYDAVSQYQGMEALDPHDPVLIEGRVLSRQRRGNTSAQFIFSMCPGSKGCLVWIDYDGVDLSQNSESVVIAGVYIGQHTYEAEDGRRRTIPRMDARFVVPL